MTTMIEAVIYNKPAVMGLVSPFSNIYMIVGEKAVMLIHETLHSLTYPYSINCRCYFRFANI